VEIKAPPINRIDRLTFPVRNIDTQVWNTFKYNAGKRGLSANDQMLYLIGYFNAKCEEE